MLKGVNKKIVEINNPQSLYFEKAILYLRPNMDNIPTNQIISAAEKYMSDVTPHKLKRKLSLKRILIVAMAFSLIGLLVYLCLTL